MYYISLFKVQLNIAQMAYILHIPVYNMVFDSTGPRVINFAGKCDLTFSFHSVFFLPAAGVCGCVDAYFLYHYG